MALCSPDTVKDIQSLVSASQVVDAFISLNDDITNLPDFKVIDSHLRAAKANAQYWQTTLFPEYKATAKSIVDSSECFVASIKMLKDLVQCLKKLKKTAETD